MQIRMTKRAGQDKADEIKRQRQKSLDDYFDSLKPYANVVDTRILTDKERTQIQFSISSDRGRKTIHIKN